MKILELISKKTDCLIEFIGKFSSILICFLILIVTLTVILRYFFSLGYVWLQDLYIWLHASIILLGVSFTLKHNGHVRIDLLYRNASYRYKSLVNLFGYIFLTLPFCVLIISYSYDYFYRSYLLSESSKETGGLPAIYILKFLIFFMGITLIMQVLNNIYKIVKDKNGNN
jgi:TRAP-type mannitol/chloroaromatic compound transport system permease small subunit